MKYLKTVILKNFQSHKHTVIEFNEGLNVIVGPSDTGKSSIIRGIKWALYNEPSGDYFIRKGETDVAVTLIFSDNTKIKRYRSKSKNQYILYDNLGEEIKYEGFGLNVPEEIIEKIGIEKIYLDSEETNSINLGEQLEGAFLLSERTSTRASAIGRLIGVNIIDDALKDTLKDLRNDNIQMKDHDQKALTLKEELKNFEYLEDLKLKLDKLEILKTTIKNKSNEKENLLKLQEKYIEYTEEIKNLKIYLKKLDTTNDLEKNIKEIDILNKNYKYFNNISKNYRYCIDEINKNQLIIEGLKTTNRLEEIQKILYENIALRSKLFKLNSEYKTYIIHQKDVNNTLYKLKDMEKVQEKLDNSSNKIMFLNNLMLLRDNYTLNQNNIEKGKTYTAKFKNLPEIDIIYNLIYTKENKLMVLEDKKKGIEDYKKSLQDEKEKQEKIALEIEEKLNKYGNLLKKQEICPLCLSKIDNEKVSHIMDHYK